MKLGLLERVSEIELGIIIPFVEARPAIKIAGIARALGVEVKAATLKPKISGQLQRTEENRDKFRIRVNRHEVAARQRFTIAHEIAHFLLHRDQIGDGIEDSILYRSSLSDSREAEANRLAAQLLMPEELVLQAWKGLGGHKDQQTLKSLAGLFDVSESAMRIRLGMT